MELRVAVSDAFGLSGADVAHGWNMAEEAAAAVAKPVEPGDHFTAAKLVGQAIVVLGSLAGGVTSNMIYDLRRSASASTAAAERAACRCRSRPRGQPQPGSRPAPIP